jgi:glyoxylase-like metal-dependent hydrolase (beta-lactamase superfamily II)
MPRACPALACLSLLLGLPARGENERTIAPGVTLVPGAFIPGTQPDGNSVILDGPGGLVVIDTGRHPAHTEAVLAVARRAGREVVAVLNTHWHLDHIGGNPAVRRAFPAARVHASDALAGARAGFLADYQKQLETLVAGEPDPEKQKPFRAELALLAAGDALAPDVVIRGSGARTLGGRRLAVRLETHAVTAGDLWILDRATRTLVAGDLVTLPAPFMDTACPRRWRAALRRLAAERFDLLVPGHGAPMRKADLRTYVAAFDGLLACGASKRPKEECSAGWQEAAAPLLGGADPAFTRSLVEYYVDTALRGDPARRAPLCG